MKPVLRLLLLTLVAFLGSLFASPDAQAFSWKTAPDEIFSGTLEDAQQNGPSAREQCRINGWLNYDTASGYTDAARNITPEVRALSEANITGNGRTVLGHYPGYIEKAQRTGSSYFDIGDAWNTLSPAQRTAANQNFLDVVTDAGDQIFLSLPKTKIRPGSALADEVQYLTGERGYQWVNQWSLRPKSN